MWWGIPGTTNLAILAIESLLLVGLYKKRAIYGADEVRPLPQENPSKNKRYPAEPYNLRGELSIVSPESETYAIILFSYNRRKKMVKSNTISCRFLELSIVSPELREYGKVSPG